ncbi:unnamed protein product [Sphenostylis stenocarpa]|uniref:Disease resistance RPP13-like protein 4 n=1 Tax=Sphenostylis stenocarpa TaxID=92480 RepID=A0AA86VKU6_9FABA|nr:unnamed protein product [Sphenostylis stenocarpa]
MSIRTNRMKAVPSLQRRLISVKSKQVSHIADKLDKLMSDLNSIKYLFSIVKSNEEELLDTLKIVDDLLRNFRTDKFFEISNRILHSDDATNTNLQKVVTIDEKLENLKCALNNLKAMFLTLKKTEELWEKFREVENSLQIINSKPAEDASQSETKALEQPGQTLREELVDQAFKVTGIDKPPSRQEVPDKTSTAEKDIRIDEKFESLKSKIEKIKGMSSTLKENEELREKLRVVEDLLRNFNAKNLPENVKPIEDSIQNETKSSELPSQASRDDSLDQDFKSSNVDKPSSSKEPKDENSVKKDVTIDERLESLKLKLDIMKVKLSTIKENEELHDMLRTLEDLLNFDQKGLAEIVKPVEDANQSEAKGSEQTNQKSRDELEDHAFKDKPSPSEEAKDKESVEKYVLVDEKLESLKSEIENMKAKLSTLAKNELLTMLRAPEDLLQNTDTKSQVRNVERVDSTEGRVEEVVKAISKKIKDSAKKLGVITKANESSDQGKASKVVHYPILSLSPDHEDVNLVLKRFQASYDALNSHSKVCCLSLSVFPENVVIKKRHIIYWWIGEGFVKNATKSTAEEEGEAVFDELLNSNLILAHGKLKCPVVNKFKINPWIRHMLVSSILGKNKQPFGFYSQIITPSHHNDVHACLVLDQQKVEIGGEFGSKSDHWRSVFNVGASYLTIEPQWMTKMNKLVVLQLGRWQESSSHHIEVNSEKFMTDLKAQKHLKYLSLRGISRISELPETISQLVSLQILDLKACHNLETLPVEITLLKKLTHLDVSQCYLLERMPKGIEKLTELQVLKGFVVGSSSKTSRISDLVNLKKLKRLSIHIGSEAVIQDREFERLVELSEVKCLKISWGVLSNTKYKDFEISLPTSLEKLSLESFPSEKTPEWLKLNILNGELKRLYITGGKLTSLDIKSFGGKYSTVEILRLKYLKRLQIDREKLKEMFPSLKYAEHVPIQSEEKFRKRYQ